MKKILFFALSIIGIESIYLQAPFNYNRCYYSEIGRHEGSKIVDQWNNPSVVLTRRLLHTSIIDFMAAAKRNGQTLGFFLEQLNNMRADQKSYPIGNSGFIVLQRSEISKKQGFPLVKRIEDPLDELRRLLPSCLLDEI